MVKEENKEYRKTNGEGLRLLHRPDKSGLLAMTEFNRFRAIRLALNNEIII